MKSKLLNKKRLIAVVALVLVAAIAAGLWLGLPGGGEPVNVYSFDYLGMTEYWGDSQESYGPVATDKIQTIFLSDTQTVTEISVKAGDKVKKGDILMSFDTTLDDLALERKRLEVEKLKLQLTEAETRLRQIRNMTPMEEPVYAAPEEPDQGREWDPDDVIPNEEFYENDGSTPQKALICWLKDGIEINNRVLSALSEKAGQFQEMNRIPSSASSIPLTIANQEGATKDDNSENIPENYDGVKNISDEDNIENVDSGNENSNGSGADNENPDGSGADNENPDGSGTDNESLNGSGADNENPDGSETDNENLNGSGADNEDPDGSGTNNENLNGSGADNEDPDGSGTNNENPNGSEADNENPDDSGTDNENPDGDKSDDEIPDEEEPEPPEPADTFYVVFKVTEDNMSNSAKLVWQGMYVQRFENEKGDTFTMRLFNASEVEDYTYEIEEEEEQTQPEMNLGGGYTLAQIVQMRAQQEKKIKDLTFDLKMGETEYKLMELELSDGNVYAEIDGEVLSVLTEEEAKSSRQPVVKVSGGGGFYVEGSVSELEKDNLKPGQEVTINDWNTGMTYTGEVKSIGDFPANDNGWNGMGNPNASYYPFQVFIDGSADLQEGRYVSITYSTATAEHGIYLENPFVLTEGGGSYVFVRGADGRLEKRAVTVGKSLWGSYKEILSGISAEDWIAFPYGKNVKDGAATVESDISALYTY